ncbi:hypothetical protein TRVA0_015S00738 [Trichomonascus vanleenenianus]|uniref:uncharacterized protein n=1 Tax=Trichomonascus vanleenenianus TaxID=2268995 RepID=UPI003EC9DC0D
MEKRVDFLQRLPIELYEPILKFLHYDDVWELRLVSRQWYRLCQRRIWIKVAIATSVSNLRDLILGYFNGAELEDDSGEYQVLNYQKLEKLGSNQQFRTTIKENTMELAMSYNAMWTEGYDKHTYESISDLFKQVVKVRVWYDPGPQDDKFFAFQNILDVLKPIAEFSLAIHCHSKKLALLDIDGMNIKDLCICIEQDCTEAQLTLPLCRSKYVAPIKWSDLNTLCKDLVTLIVFTAYNIFRSRLIPDTIKHLELTNTSTLGEDYTGGSLIVPPGVEYLYISDGFQYPYLHFGNAFDSLPASILACMDLSRVRQLKRFQYRGGDATHELIQSILQVRGTLVWLSIACHRVTSFSIYEFRELASEGLGLTHLKLTLGSFGKELSDYQDFLTEFPALKLLEIDVNNYTRYLVTLCEDCKFNVMKGLIASFLRGSPKLSHIQLQSQMELNLIDDSVPWITRANGKQLVVYDVNVCEARSLLN